MKIDRIAYEQLFPTGVYANQRYRVEILLDERDYGIVDEKIVMQSDAAQKAFEYARKIVEDTFASMNPQINWLHDNPMFHPPTDENSMYPPKVFYAADQQVSSKESAIESHIKTINECKTLNNLKIFEKLVTNTNHPELTEAFNNKLKSFE